MQEHVRPSGAKRRALQLLMHGGNAPPASCRAGASDAAVAGTAPAAGGGIGTGDSMVGSTQHESRPVAPVAPVRRHACTTGQHSHRHRVAHGAATTPAPSMLPAADTGSPASLHARVVQSSANVASDSSTKQDGISGGWSSDYVQMRYDFDASEVPNNDVQIADLAEWRRAVPYWSGVFEDPSPVVNSKGAQNKGSRRSGRNRSS